MKMNIKFTNNASAQLASAVTASATAMILAGGVESTFPSLAAGEYFYCTVTRRSDNKREIVKVTSRSGAALTVLRAQDDTTALEFVAGDIVEHTLNAASLNEIIGSAVGNTGNETIAGVKTFTSPPVFPPGLTLPAGTVLPSGAVTVQGSGAVAGELQATYDIPLSSGGKIRYRHFSMNVTESGWNLVYAGERLLSIDVKAPRPGVHSFISDSSNSTNVRLALYCIFSKIPNPVTANANIVGWESTSQSNVRATLVTFVP